MSETNKPVVKPCPRRKVVSVIRSWDSDHLFEYATLTLECGHDQQVNYLRKTWKPPKTMHCGMCWRKSGTVMRG